MAAGHTPQAPDTIAPIGPSGAFNTGRRDVGVPGGALTPVASPTVSPNAFLARDRIRRSGFAAIVLKDVAWGPMMEAGATVPDW
jgi:hypothetical protein